MLKEIANRLNGREYGQELTPTEAQQAKEAGVVIVFGASDDLMEFRGAINDEVGCYDGGTAYLTHTGLFENKCNDDDCPYVEKERQSCKTIEAVWCGASGFAWSYETDIPHECFDILEDGEPYCRGIVFSIASLAESEVTK